MLVKFESDEILDEQIEFLKKNFNVGTASKAISMAAKDYMKKKELAEHFKFRYENQVELYNELKSLVRQKAQIEASIRSLTGQ